MYSDFKLLARYNSWVNIRLYECAEQLSDEQRREDRGAFFKSVFATLNHIAVGDLLWMRQFATHPAAFSSLQGIDNYPKPTSLDYIPYTSWEDLKQARQQLDQILESFASEITEAQSREPFTYKSIRGFSSTRTFGSLVLHMFNHQTHHRGQVSTLLTQFGLETPAMDLPHICEELTA